MSGVYERTVLANMTLSTTLTESPVKPRDVFKDSDVFEFLSLPHGHKEMDLKHA